MCQVVMQYAINTKLKVLITTLVLFKRYQEYLFMLACILNGYTAINHDIHYL